MCSRCCGVTQQKGWVFGSGVLFLLFGLLTITCWPTFIDDMIMKELPLAPKSKTFNMWKTTPIPVYLHMYLFNWTNAADAYKPGIKPNFKLMGPYVYREMRRKQNIVWYENKTVSFKGSRTWFFEPEMSGGKEDDLITVPHLPTVAATNAMRNSATLTKIIFNVILNKHGGALYVTHTAVDWLFNGFYDEFLDYAMHLNSSFAPPIDTNQFAWFLGRNGSKEFEGLFTIHTGQGDIKEMGEIKFWNGKNHTGWYQGECGRLNGSTTDLFVPGEPLEKPLTIFVTDTCRIINLEFTGKKVIIEGIQGWKYEATKNTFDNGQVNAHMKCYCPSNLQPDNCPASGATDLSPCAKGAPIYMSAANFMYADPSYANTTTGWEPNYERDNFFIVIERKLGVPLQVNAAIQINLLIKQDRHFDILKGIPDFYAPLFIIGSQAIMSKELGKEVRLVLNVGSIGRYVGIGIFGVGFILITLGSLMTIIHKWHGQNENSESSDRMEIINTNDDDTEDVSTIS